MSALFDLVGEYKELYAMLTDDPENETIQDTLEAVTGELEVKGEGYVAIINKLDMEIDACKKQKEMWTQNLKVRENALERLKTRLTDAMIQLGKTEIKAGDNTIKLMSNSVAPVIIDDADAVPTEYKRVIVDEKIDKTKIGEALKRGETFNWCHLGEKGKHIRIK